MSESNDHTPVPWPDSREGLVVGQVGSGRGYTGPRTIVVDEMA